MKKTYDLWCDFISLGSGHKVKNIEGRQYQFNWSYPSYELAIKKSKELYEKFGCRTLVLEGGKS